MTLVDLGTLRMFHLSWLLYRKGFITMFHCLLTYHCSSDLPAGRGCLPHNALPRFEEYQVRASATGFPDAKCPADPGGHLWRKASEPGRPRCRLEGDDRSHASIDLSAFK